MKYMLVMIVVLYCAVVWGAENTPDMVEQYQESRAVAIVYLKKRFAPLRNGAQCIHFISGIVDIPIKGVRKGDEVWLGVFPRSEQGYRLATYRLVFLKELSKPRIPEPIEKIDCESFRVANFTINAQFSYFRAYDASLYQVKPADYFFAVALPDTLKFQRGLNQLKLPELNAEEGMVLYKDVDIIRVLTEP